MSRWPMVSVAERLRMSRQPIELDPFSQYSATGVRSFGGGLIRYPPAVPAELSKMRYFRLQPNHLVVSNIKAWEGAIATTGTEVMRDAVVSNRFLCYDAKDERIDVEFVKWYLLSARGLAKLSQASPGSADRNRTLSINGFESLEIPTPCIAEQRRIADWLSRIEREALQVNRVLIPAEALESGLREALFIALRQPVNEWYPLAELLTQREFDVALERTAPFSPAGVYSFGRGLFHRPAITGADTSYRTMTTIRAGDFVYSKLMAWEGAVAVASDQDDGLLATPEFPVFALDRDRLNAEYFGALIRTESFGSELRRLSTGTNARRRRVHPSTMMGVEIPLPPMKVQEHVAEIAGRLKRRGARRKLAQERLSALLPAALNQVFGSLN